LKLDLSVKLDRRLWGPVTSTRDERANRESMDVENSGGKAAAQELQNSTLVAQQLFLSEVISTDDWLKRIQS